MPSDNDSPYEVLVERVRDRIGRVGSGKAGEQYTAVLNSPVELSDAHYDLLMEAGVVFLEGGQLPLAARVFSLAVTWCRENAKEDERFALALILREQPALRLGSTNSAAIGELEYALRQLTKPGQIRALALLATASAYEHVHDLRKAAERSTQSNALYAALNIVNADSENAAEMAARHAESLHGPEAALAYSQRAVEIAVARGRDENGLLRLKARAGTLALAAGDGPCARSMFSDGLAHGLAGQPDEQAAIDLNAIGVGFLGIGDTDLAWRACEASREMWSTIGREVPVEVVANLGAIAGWQGRLNDAVELLTEVLNLSQDDPEQEATTRNNLAYIELELGNLDQAFGHITRAIDLQLALDSSQSGPTQALARKLNTLGLLHLAVGEPEPATIHFRRALAIHTQAAPRSLEVVNTRANLAKAVGRTGGLHDARKLYAESLDLVRLLAPDSRDCAVAWQDLGYAELSTGNPDEALSCFRSAEAIHSRLGPSVEAGNALHGMGTALLASGDRAAALDAFGRALEVRRVAAPNSVHCAISLRTIGELQEAANELDAAIDCHEEAVHVIEEARSRAGDPESRESLFAQHQRPYHALISALHKRSATADHARAFQIAEGARGRGFLDIFSERDLELALATPEATTLRNEIQSLERELADTRRGVDAASAAGDPTADELILRSQETADALKRARVRLRGITPVDAELRYPQPLDVGEVQQFLEPGAVMISYSASQDGNAFIWTVDHQRFSMSRVQVSGAELARLTRSVVGMLAKPQSDQSTDDIAARLGELLLPSAVADLLSSANRLIVVPDGPLHYLPFDVLPVRGEGPTLGERIAVSYAPSATLLRALAQKTGGSPSGQFVGFGDPQYARMGDQPTNPDARIRGKILPRLPGTRLEVETIAGIFGAGSRVFLGPEATESNVLRHAAGYRFVHFATHGLLDDRNPRYSGLALSPPKPEEHGLDPRLDDVLEVYEMASLRLSADLVVCSACQTALGTIRAGEGMVGMARALLCAGAKCVIASLWSVPDQATAELMIDLYQGLHQGKPIAEALRTAKERLRERGYEDPYFWAAFVPIGLAT